MNKLEILCKGKNCGVTLLNQEEVCLYFSSPTSVFLIIKPGIPTPNSITESQTNSPKQYSVGQLKCRKCGWHVGNRLPQGPNQEIVSNFALQKRDVIIRGFEFTHKKTSAIVAKLQEEFPGLQKINGLTFSPTPKIKYQEFWKIKTEFPSLMDAKRFLGEGKLEKVMRDYQTEMYMCGVNSNCLINLPTGTGKTLIAFYLITLFHQLNPKKSILFLAPQVILTSQQHYNFKKEWKDSQCKVYEVHSDTNNAEDRKKFIEDGGILFATPQIPCNWLHDGVIDIRNFSLIIFDECHNGDSTKSRHPYAEILKARATMMKKRPEDAEYFPRVFGMTGTLFSKTPKSINEVGTLLSELKESFVECNVYKPTILENSPIMRIKTTTEFFHADELTCVDEEKMVAHIQKVLDAALGSWTCTINELRREPTQTEKLFMEFLQDSIKLMPVYGIHMTFSRLLSEGRKVPLSCRSDTSIQLWYKKLTDELQEQFPTLLNRSDEKMQYSAKTADLFDIFALPEVESNIKIIIFLAQKRSVKALKEILDHRDDLKKIFNFQCIYGKTGDVRLTGAKQKNRIDEFRKGECKCLLSTSVLEEGLDVADCNYVIRFDKFFSYKSLVQSRGRARAKDSRYLILLNNEDRTFYEKLLAVEKYLDKCPWDTIPLHVRKEIAGTALQPPIPEQPVFQSPSHENACSSPISDSPSSPFTATPITSPLASPSLPSKPGRRMSSVQVTILATPCTTEVMDAVTNLFCEYQVCYIEEVDGSMQFDFAVDEEKLAGVPLESFFPNFLVANEITMRSGPPFWLAFKFPHSFESMHTEDEIELGLEEDISWNQNNQVEVTNVCACFIVGRELMVHQALKDVAELNLGDDTLELLIQTPPTNITSLFKHSHARCSISPGMKFFFQITDWTGDKPLFLSFTVTRDFLQQFQQILRKANIDLYFGFIDEIK